MLLKFTVYQKIILLISSALVLSGAVLWYIQQKTQKELTAMKEQAQMNMMQVEQLQKKLAISIAHPDLSKGSRLIPAEWEMPLFFDDLTLAAKETGVTLVTVTPANPDKQGNGNNQSGITEVIPPKELSSIHLLDIAIHARGSRDNLVLFLDRLQNMPRLAWVKDYSIDFESRDTPLRLNLTIFSHASWNNKLAASIEWPFQRESAN